MTPYASRAQQGFMFAKHPRIAREMADKTNDFKSLPYKVKSRKNIAAKKRGKNGK